MNSGRRTEGSTGMRDINYFVIVRTSKEDNFLSCLIGIEPKQHIVYFKFAIEALLLLGQIQGIKWQMCGSGELHVIRESVKVKFGCFSEKKVSKAY